MENDGGRIVINPDRFDKLITSLRTAVDIDGTLIKNLHPITIYLMQPIDCDIKNDEYLELFEQNIPIGKRS